MARNSSGIVVAGLTAAALAVVAVLAVQASAAKERDDEQRAKPSPSASPSAGDDTSDAPKEDTAVPPGSGQGKRVVYSLESDRVWLVEEDGRASRTYKVSPGTVDPAPGSYRVTSRDSHVTGTDGVPIENVVRFADVDGVTVGFSAALDGSSPQPDPQTKTGGIRESREDGEAMWLFAALDTQVVVVR